MILEQQNMQGNEVYQECESLDGHLHEILRHTKDTSFRPRASQARARGKLASKPKQKFNGRRTLQKSK